MPNLSMPHKLSDLHRERAPHHPQRCSFQARFARDAAIDASGSKPRAKHENLGSVAEPEVPWSEVVEIGFRNMVEKNPPQRKPAKQVDAKVSVGRIKNGLRVAMPVATLHLLCWPLFSGSATLNQMAIRRLLNSPAWPLGECKYPERDQVDERDEHHDRP
jgi:hypothetical protein